MCLENPLLRTCFGICHNHQVMQCLYTSQQTDQTYKFRPVIYYGGKLCCFNVLLVIFFVIVGTLLQISYRYNYGGQQKTVEYLRFTYSKSLQCFATSEVTTQVCFKMNMFVVQLIMVNQSFTKVLVCFGNHCVLVYLAEFRHLVSFPRQSSAVDCRDF